MSKVGVFLFLFFFLNLLTKKISLKMHFICVELP